MRQRDSNRRTILARVFPVLLTPLVSVAVSFAIGAFLIVLNGENPLEVYSLLVQGAFVGRQNLALTLTFTSPLIFVGLSVTLAHRSGLFNIGGEGQILIGGIVASWIGVVLAGVPAGCHLLLAVIAAMIAGGIWGGIAGALKAKFGVHEVIATIMLNHIALLLTDYLVNYPFKAPGIIPQSPVVARTALFPMILPGTVLDASIFLALIMSVLVYVFLWHTKYGYELRAVGLNPDAAEAKGISVAMNTVIAMSLAGAMSGLGGASYVLGFNERFIGGTSPGYGSLGISVALLGKRHPVGVIIAAVLFGALKSGALLMDVATNIPKELIVVLQAIIIFLVVTAEMAEKIYDVSIRRLVGRWSSQPVRGSGRETNV